MMVNPKTCSKCGRPVAPEMKFCESCGARIEPVQSCTKCGAALAPGVRFCESCGTPVASVETMAKAPKEEPGPEGATVLTAPEPEKNKKESPRSRPLIDETPVEGPLVSPAASTISSVPRPAPIEKNVSPAEPPADDVQIEAAVAAAVDAWTSPESGTGDPAVAKETSQKKPVPQKTVIIAGILILALLGAAAYFVVLPMLSVPGTSGQNQQVIPTTKAGSSSGTSGPTTDPGLAGTVTLTAGPTQVPPYNRVVVVDVERDPITSIITVTFQGGSGQYGVRELAVTLTKSDGTVERKSFKPETRDSFITLQGTAKTDRVEVTANFYNGESYKVIDQIFEYKKRSG